MIDTGKPPEVGTDAALSWLSQAHYLRVALIENLTLSRKREAQFLAEPCAELALALTGLNINAGILQCTCLEFALKALISLREIPPRGQIGHDCTHLWSKLDDGDRQRITVDAAIDETKIAILLSEASKSVAWRYAITPSGGPPPPKMDATAHMALLDSAMALAYSYAVAARPLPSERGGNRAGVALGSGESS